MATDTVRVDREAVMALLVEAEGVANALAKIAGSFPTPLTELLEEKASRVADQVVGVWPPNDTPSPRLDLHEAGHERGRQLLRELVGEEVGANA